MDGTHKRQVIDAVSTGHEPECEVGQSAIPAPDFENGRRRYVGQLPQVSRGQQMQKRVVRKGTAGDCPAEHAADIRKNQLDPQPLFDGRNCFIRFRLRNTPVAFRDLFGVRHRQSPTAESKGAETVEP